MIAMVKVIDRPETPAPHRTLEDPEAPVNLCLPVWVSDCPDTHDVEMLPVLSGDLIAKARAVYPLGTFRVEDWIGPRSQLMAFLRCRMVGPDTSDWQMVADLELTKSADGGVCVREIEPASIEQLEAEFRREDEESQDAGVIR